LYTAQYEPVEKSGVGSQGSVSLIFVLKLISLEISFSSLEKLEGINLNTSTRT
jgi:hypothetical protein